VPNLRPAQAGTRPVGEPEDSANSLFYLHFHARLRSLDGAMRNPGFRVRHMARQSILAGVGPDCASLHPGTGLGRDQRLSQILSGGRVRCLDTNSVMFA
jgi:hypothetical protein